MRLVIQRVNHASVRVDGNVIGSIGKGLLILLGVANGDTKEMVDRYVKKLSGLRIFEDAGSFWLCHSLHCMPTVRKETGQAL